MKKLSDVSGVEFVPSDIFSGAFESEKEDIKYETPQGIGVYKGEKFGFLVISINGKHKYFDPKTVKKL